MRILHIDNDPRFQNVVKLVLERFDPTLDVTSVLSAQEALTMLEEESFDCILSDYYMDNMNGLDLVREVKRITKTPFILYTGKGSEDVASEAFEAGVDDYIRKAVDAGHNRLLLRRIRMVVEKYRTEQALLKSDERHSSFMDESTDGFLLCDLEMNILEINQAGLVCLDAQMDEALSKPLIGLLPFPDKKGFEKAMSEVAETGEPVSVDFNFFHPEMGEKFVNVRIFKAGLGFGLITTNVTDMKQYEMRLQALSKSASRLYGAETIEDTYEIILETVTSVLGFGFVGVAVLEPNAIHYVKTTDPINDESFKIPLDQPSVTGRAFATGESQLIPDIRLDPHYVSGPFSESLQRLSELSVPVKVDGEVELVINLENERLNAFSDKDRELVETLANHVASSIQVIRYREELQKSMVELARSNKELDDYTYVVSHDLRAPLRSITAFSEFLMEDYMSQLDESGQEYLTRIHSSCMRLDDFINDLLALSRIGRKFVEEEVVDLNEVIGEIRQDFEAQLKERGAEIVSSKLPVITTQKVWMHQLLANLIGNGLKFNKSEKPRVVINCEDRQGVYVFSVRDNGIGIDPESQVKLFQLFQRLHSEEEYEGTGAGLAICKKIAESLGGKIWVESQPGSGSNFLFTIPNGDLEGKKTRYEMERLLEASQYLPILS